MGTNFDLNDRANLSADLRQVLLNTEHSGNAGSIYTFSNAGGSSGWSFGLSQIDVKNNAAIAIPFLQSIGFTSAQITLLGSGAAIPSAQLQSMNNLLAANKGAIDSIDSVQIDHEIDKLDNLINQIQLYRPDVASTILADPTLQLKLLDYDNQFTLDGVSSNPAAPVASTDYMLRYLDGGEVTLPGGVFSIAPNQRITSDDIADFMDNTKQGLQSPGSTENRNVRFDNAIQQIQQNIFTLPVSSVPLGTAEIDASGSGFQYNTPELAANALALSIYPAPQSASLGGADDPDATARAQLAATLTEQLTGKAGTFTISKTSDGDLAISGTDGTEITLNADLSGSDFTPSGTAGAGSYKTFDPTGATESDIETSVTVDWKPFPFARTVFSRQALRTTATRVPLKRPTQIRLTRRSIPFRPMLRTEAWYPQSAR